MIVRGMRSILVMLDGSIWRSKLTTVAHGIGEEQYLLSDRYGAKLEDFAEIGRISHEHSQRNPYAQFQQKYSLKEIQESTMIYEPLTKLQCSPTSDGAGAAVIVSERFLEKNSQLKSQAILMAGQALRTDDPSLYSKSAMDLVGFGMSKTAAEQAMKEAGVTPKDISVCELHDCFSANELILLEGLGFAEKGKAHELVRNGDITYGGKGPVINPSGGLISKGHPLGATGLAQCCELTWQLRGKSRLSKRLRSSSTNVECYRLGQQPPRPGRCGSPAQLRSRWRCRGQRVQTRRWQEERRA